MTALQRSTKKYILVTGAAGYIGSHMAGMLLQAGYPVIVFDNLSSGVKSWVPHEAIFIKGDLCNTPDLDHLFKKYSIETVIHFAAKINIPESLLKPQIYYRNNVSATANLLSVMAENKVRRIVFSSTAAVYGTPEKNPVTEKFLTEALNPYGTSKLMCEKILQDMAKTKSIDFIVFRYFNVAGWNTRRSWPTEDRPQTTHLISNVMRALKENRPMTIYGTDYKTHDGTGVRDFIHVVDLCKAHLLAIKALKKGIINEVFNLGSGHGFSVLDIINMAALVVGKPVPHKAGPRRRADVASVVASFAKAKRILGWEPQFNLETIIKSEWEKLNPTQQDKKI